MIAAVFSRSAWIPSSLITCPRNVKHDFQFLRIRCCSCCLDLIENIYNSGIVFHSVFYHRKVASYPVGESESLRRCLSTKTLPSSFICAQAKLLADDGAVRANFRTINLGMSSQTIIELFADEGQQSAT